MVTTRINLRHIVPSLIVALSFSFPQCSLREGQPRPEVPLAISPGGLILVNVTVADSAECSFILDTGAGVHVLSEKLFKRLHSTFSGRFTGFRHTGERVSLDLYEISSLSLGEFRQENPLVAPLAALDGTGIDGILSAKFFEHFPFTLDLPGKRLVFESTQSASRRMSNGSTIPLRVSDVRGKSLDLFATFALAGEFELECIIDTGSPAVVLDSRYLKALNIDEHAGSLRRGSRRSLFGAQESELDATVASFGLAAPADASVRNFAVAFKDSLIYDGLVGNSFWLPRVITINIPERYLVVQSGR
jgi:hypothetical protein